MKCHPRRQVSHLITSLDEGLPQNMGNYTRDTAIFWSLSTPGTYTCELQLANCVQEIFLLEKYLEATLVRLSPISWVELWRCIFHGILLALMIRQWFIAHVVLNGPFFFYWFLSNLRFSWEAFFLSFWHFLHVLLKLNPNSLPILFQVVSWELNPFGLCYSQQVLHFILAIHSGTFPLHSCKKSPHLHWTYYFSNDPCWIRLITCMY